MKLRCPYCQGTYDQKTSRCPHCGKLAVLPAKLRRTTFREREKLRGQIERRANRQRREVTVHSFRPGRDPRFLFMAMFVLVLCGALLFSRSSHVNDRVPIDKRFQLVASEMEVLRVAAERFRLDAGRYPTTDEGLLALVQRPEGMTNWGGYYVTVVTPDPWKQPYLYESRTNGTITITSGGPDKTLGTGDDIAAPDLLTIVHRQLRRYVGALEAFHSDTGRYPSKGEGLGALLQAPKVPGWRGPYFTYLPRDPWERDYYYMPEGNGYDLRAMGPDQTPHTADDIVPTPPERPGPATDT